MEKFRKYLERKNSPMSQQHQEILAKGEEMPAAHMLDRKKVNALLDKGYLAGENGYKRLNKH